MDKNDYVPLIQRALQEDLCTEGDVTSQAIFTHECGKAVLLSKDTGILAGSQVFTEVFHLVDQSVKVSFSYSDGQTLVPGNAVAHLSGNVCSILKAERTAINFLSLITGIATRTGTYVSAAKENGNVCILDTRKTIPGYRALSKYAVRVGGGTNHRLGLYDMVLIKDNHIDAAGGITEAVKRIKEKWSGRFRIEVECRTIEDVKEALDCGIDVIMLDNMSPEQIAEAVAVVDKSSTFVEVPIVGGEGKSSTFVEVPIVGGEGESSTELRSDSNFKRGERVKLEVSGQMDIEKIKRIRNVGIDYISVGKLTKSVESFDFSLDIEI